MNNKNARSKEKRTGSSGEIRIIAGTWRGRKLPVLTRSGLRPTTDRIKETVFNWLAPYVPSAVCLDCYAGSGALAFEAVSRGANAATLLEKNHTVYLQLTANRNKLNASTLTLIHADTLDYLQSATPSPFDIAFVDPPFDENLVPETAALLEEKGWLSNTALIYIETRCSQDPLSLPVNWYPYREKKAGQVCYRLYQRHDAAYQ